MYSSLVVPRARVRHDESNAVNHALASSRERVDERDARGVEELRHVEELAAGVEEVLVAAHARDPALAQQLDAAAGRRSPVEDIAGAEDLVDRKALKLRESVLQGGEPGRDRKSPSSQAKDIQTAYSQPYKRHAGRADAGLRSQHCSNWSNVR